MNTTQNLLDKAQLYYSHYYFHILVSVGTLRDKIFNYFKKSNFFFNKSLYNASCTYLFIGNLEVRDLDMLWPYMV